MTDRRTYADSPVGPSYLDVGADIGATELTLTADDLPESLTANFSITVSTGAATESLTVSERDGATLTLAEPTTKAHAANAIVEHQLTATDAENFAQLADLEEIELTPGPTGPTGAKGDKGDPGDPATNLVTSVAGKTGAVTLDASDVGLGNVSNDAQVKKSGDTTAGDLTIGTRMFLPNGSASAPAEAFTTSNQAGQFLPAVNQVGFATAGAERIRIGSFGLTVTGSVTPTGVLNNGLGQLTAGAQTLNLGTTPGELEVATASTIQLFLPQVSWNRTTTPVYMISDPRGILTNLEIYPFPGFDFTGTDQNSINEGFGSEGVWDDGMAGYGPAGAFAALTTPGCLWRLSVQRNNPGVSGGSGGWKLQKLASGGYA